MTTRIFPRLQLPTSPVALDFGLEALGKSFDSRTEDLRPAPARFKVTGAEGSRLDIRSTSGGNALRVHDGGRRGFTVR